MYRNEAPSPLMQRLFDKTQIPEGTCYIDHLEISSLDGRSCGFESYIRASGLKYLNGRAEQYLYEEYDVPLKDFFAQHADCIFLSDGALQFHDEVGEMSLSTVIRNIKAGERLFPWFESPADLTMEMTSVAYEKLCHLHDEAQKSAPSLSDKISSASRRAGPDGPTREQMEKNLDDGFCF